MGLSGVGHRDLRVPRAPNALVPECMKDAVEHGIAWHRPRRTDRRARKPWSDHSAEACEIAKTSFRPGTASLTTTAAEVRVHG
jgi:hypothetical protein